MLMQLHRLAQLHVHMLRGLWAQLHVLWQLQRTWGTFDRVALSQPEHARVQAS